MKLGCQFLAILLGLFALTQSGSATGSTAPIPEFMDQEQSAKWRKRCNSVASASEAGSESVQTQPFFSGKPFERATASYIFKYREYNPELGRWTASDPGGFPDGPNNYLYTANPLVNFDPTGLVVKAISNTDFISARISTSDLSTAMSRAISGLSAPGGISPTLWAQGVTLVSNRIASWVPNIPVANFVAQVTAQGNYDTNTESWSNPAIVFAPGQSASTTVGGGVGQNAQMTGTVGYSILYQSLGNPNFSTPTFRTTDVMGNFIPQIITTLGVSFPGISVTGSGGANAGSQQYRITLME